MLGKVSPPGGVPARNERSSLASIPIQARGADLLLHEAELDWRLAELNQALTQFIVDATRLGFWPPTTSSS
jgi:hypothetical protein